MPTEEERMPCPQCGEPDLIAVTYAYHNIIVDPLGPQLAHQDWSDEYALVCHSCGWGEGDPTMPNLTGNIAGRVKMPAPEKTYRVTINEVRAYTWRVKARNSEQALRKAREEDGVYEGSDFLDYWGDPDMETDVEEVKA